MKTERRHSRRWGLRRRRSVRWTLRSACAWPTSARPGWGWLPPWTRGSVDAGGGTGPIADGAGADADGGIALVDAAGFGVLGEDGAKVTMASSPTVTPEPIFAKASPPSGRNAVAVHACPFPLPVPQAPPAGRAPPAAHLHREILPGNAGLEHEADAGQARMIGDTGPSALWVHGHQGSSGSMRSKSEFTSQCLYYTGWQGPRPKQEESMKRPLVLLALTWRNVKISTTDLLMNFLPASRVVPPSGRYLLYRALGVNVDRSVIHSGCYLGTNDVSIGRGTFINRDCFFEATDHIEIGSNCHLAMGVRVLTSTHEIGPHQHRGGTLKRRPVKVGNGVWIGAFATLLPGVTVGDGCVIGAGAVVTKDCLPDGLYLGIPAKRERELFVGGDETMQRLK